MSQVGHAALRDALRARFREIYEREIGFAYNLLRRLGVQSGDVEDVAQELFTSVHMKLDEYDASRPIRPWIAGFAVHSAASYRRRLRKREIPVEGTDRASIGSGAARRDAHEAVMRGLETLEDDQREVLVLHDLYGHSMKETATILGIPINTGYSRLRVARERFRSVVLELQREAG